MPLQINQMVRVRSARSVTKQNIRILNRIVVNRKQRCLECGGIGQLINGRISLLVNIEQEYPHLSGCSMKGRF